MKTCPFCSSINENFEEKCEECNKPLLGQEYLKTLLEKYKKIVRFQRSERFEYIKSLEVDSDDKTKSDKDSSVIELIKNQERIYLKQIKDAFGQAVEITIKDVGLRKELQKIRDMNLSDQNSRDYDPSWNDFVWEYRLDLPEFMSSISVDPAEFEERAREVGAVMIGESIPGAVEHNLHQAKECYLYGLFNPTVVFCRALIEVGLTEALMKKGKYEEYSRVIYPDKRDQNLDNLIKACKTLDIVSEELINIANSVRKKANTILHTKWKVIHLSKEETLSVVKDTFKLLENIYT